MEQAKQKIFRMLKNYSPKQIKTYVSNGSLDSYRREPSSIKKIGAQQPHHYKKPTTGSRQQKADLKYALNKPRRSTYKLGNKQDSSKQHFLNYTAYGTPFDKSTILSYVSTPKEKPFNLNMKSLNVTINQEQVYSKPIKSYKKFATKQHFPSTEEENFSQHSVTVKFVISTQMMGNSLTKTHAKDGKENRGSSQPISYKSVYRTYSNYVTFSSMKREFLKDKECLSDKVKNNYYGLVGFETVPYNYSLTNTINNQPQCTFEWLLSKNIRQITLSPNLIRKKINYEGMEFKDFQILQYLGCGGFSSVYLAKCLIDGQMCALKFIQKDSITSSKKVKMLQNQTNILFTIGHPNLVDLYYAFQTQNYIVFGLEYCPNGNLYSFLQKKKTLSENQAKLIFKQILNGLEYLHDQNILFRDIKLENILFDEQGLIKITDFGLSKPDLSQEEITYSYCGSPQYMAPQMLSKEGHSFGVDYYALGILLYELLYGRSPFYASKKQEIFVAILNTDPVFPKNYAVSKEAKALIKGLLAKNPTHRIGSLKGIKQIASHPWLRNYKLETDKQNAIRFEVPYETTFQSKLKDVGSSPHHTQVSKCKLTSSKDMSSVFTSSKNHGQSESKRWKQIFEQQKQYTNPSKFFFDQSFVNRNILERVQKEVVPFQINQRQKISDESCMNSRNIIRNSYLNSMTHTLDSHCLNKSKYCQRGITSKSSSKSKLYGKPDF